MNTEVTKINGKEKAAVKKAPAKPADKPKKPEKVTPWSMARTMLAQGKSPDAIKAAVYDHLVKTLNPKAALESWAMRLTVRALFRAKKTAATAAKTEKKASKKKEA